MAQGNEGKRISRFVLDWYDNGPRMENADCHVRTVFSRDSRTLIIRHMKGGKGMYYETRIPATTEMTEEFFRLVTLHEWEDDYSVPVCDGYSWEMTLMSGRSAVTRSRGTVCAPPRTRLLEEMLREIVQKSGCTDVPPLWGNDFWEEEED